MPSTSIIWVAHQDERTCPICKAIHGYVWNFSVEEGVPDFLTHPTFGIVWMTGIGSQAHGHERYNCRCGLKAEVHAEDLQDKIRLLMTAIEEMAVYTEFLRYGQTVGAFRSLTTGRFVRPSR